MASKSKVGLTEEKPVKNIVTAMKKLNLKGFLATRISAGLASK